MKNLPFSVSWDNHDGTDWDESFSTLREAMRCYRSMTNVPYKDVTFDSRKFGTVTLLNSKGTDNLLKYGFLPYCYD